ncbi:MULTISPECIES: type ISP restriction/modification enzyme [Nostocales]|jgi:predicted helicase|uniref:site-specific DNA-methyltransferase (adenine-specific) n=1 Tax=Aphanizomenon flos-aquae FACHB-1040 TaxID=2692887 RepID=A0ABR8BQS2_APHFL|nr:MULTISPECIES: type ISP restriction/modification enzyme [Nostocales]MBO1069160.1 N-6 DNA methylase [Dolichospermum sp. DEX189]MCX5983285.1 N-6 DNA methylase [Nostocales cyanobacterium LacPavin_0920_SED1_MAG_38_18]ALB42347.1 DNA methyltransferase [Anabaena sp. WA102]MBD2277273.1 N-6 DNA methylase [Aphanizomenon flos-aquae FACHB-1040]OBQ20369.1 MAG: DNA methyltransferase [Anabaena sp. AL93]
MNNLQTYIQEITQIYQQQNATEHTYRPALKKLIDSLDSQIQAINEPKRIACGAPDFVVKNGILEIGHIEAKDIGISLKKVEKTTQMGRYFQALGNLILTDYLEFRWYIQGELKLTASLGTIDKNKKIKVDKEGIQEVDQLLRQFLLAKVPQVTTPKDLAKRMASLAQLMRDAIKTALHDVDNGGMLRQQLESFQRVLIKDLTVEQFADMYAQTICYGLFAARCNTDNVNTFSRETAAFKLPKTNPFLRSIFGQIAGPDLDDRISWAVDNLANILQQTEMAEILKDFGKRTRREDPVVHFYETFLAEYDPKMRESRGVYYTPEPVVDYIVKSVDYILKHKFNISKGLADSKKIKIPNPKGEGTIETHQVLILDPAVGTGTFMHSVIDFIYDKFKSQKGMWSSYVSQHLLPRLFGFELLMAPYTVAHMKLGLQLQELGYDFSSDERLRIYLTNTLQEAFQIPAADGFMNRIRDEAEAAKDIKQDVPVMVILGNPPYSYESINTDPWIVGLVRDYYQVDGKPLGERNPKGLLDDYVKFIRFAQHRVSETGYGIVALITNHGYLDNPTFRGMRQNLMQTFDEIYVLDLHGNSKKKEVCPDGSQDKNVFDIQQGVAISIFIKYEHSQQKLASVYHADLWGMREVYENKELVGGKYHWLAENDISSTDWKIVKPEAKFYLFNPQNTSLSSEYEQGWKVIDIMLVNAAGIKTHRDHFAIDFEEESITQKFRELRETNLSNEDYSNKYNIHDHQDWRLDKVRQLIRLDNQWEDKIISCLYRPFDWRYCYYSDLIMDRPRRELLDHVFRKDNLCLGLGRQGIAVNDPIWSLVSVANQPIDTNIFRRGGVNIFPLYLYPTDTPTLFDSIPTNTPRGRKPNLSPEFIIEFSQKLDLEFMFDGKSDKNKTFRPEDIFNYIYAIFHSPIYRQRYAEFLKIDFPRVPLTANSALFWELVIKGDKLVKYHLMKETGTEISTYPIPGSDIVEQVKYNENHQQIWINSEQYFDQVPQQIWNFYIGGYQVCQKWLKDRKGRQLNFDDISHYQNIISIISETIKIMEDIDQIIEKYGGFPLE